MFKPCYVKSRYNVSAESIVQEQSAPSAQADLGQYFSLLVNFLHVKGPGLACMPQPFPRMLSFSPRFCKFEYNATSDWLNHTV